MKILGIGEAIIDAVYSVHGSADKSYNTEGLHAEQHIGGPVLSALIVLARLGVDCTMVTTLGRDPEAKLIKKALKHEKIKVLSKISRHTKVNKIVVNKADGTRAKIRGDIIHTDIKNLDRKFVRQFDCIIIDRHEKTAFYEILKKKRPDTRIIIDPSTEISPYTLDMIKYADYPVLPIESLNKISPQNINVSLQQLHLHAQKTLIVTAGALGSIIYDGTNITLIPAYDVTAVDVNGAGDVYRGAFAYGIMCGWDITKSATFGNFVAGLQCTKLGNMSAIPTKAEMLVFQMTYQRKEMSMPAVNEYFEQTLIV